MDENINVVTGSGGYVGFALVKELESRGEKMRLILHSKSGAFDGISCEKVAGDIGDPEFLSRAFEGARTVYHAAGVVDISGKKDKLVWKVNVDGTKNVIAACKKAGVKNLVYVSSVDAIPVKDDDKVIREISRFDPDLLEGAYAKSKAVASQCVINANGEDLKTLVVHPSACLGPYDYHGSSSVATMIRLYSKGLFPMTFDFGGYNFVDVRDAAKGMAAAAEKGRGGECYILCGRTAVSLDGFVGILAELNGGKRPKIVFKKKTLVKCIPLFSKAADLLKLPPVVNEYSIRKICENCNFSCEKARRELGYDPRPLYDSLRDTIAWTKDLERQKKRDKKTAATDRRTARASRRKP